MPISLIELSDMRSLLRIAQAAVEQGLELNPPPAQSRNEYPESLRLIRGSFVTLKCDARLRGCIGTLRAIRPLAEDVAKNAAAAAFRDPRFPPVSQSEAASLHYHISVLSPQSPLEFAGIDDLLDALQPGVHGLVLAHGGRQATYLPSVWDAIADKRTFVEQLRAKAGIAATTPAAALDAWVYTVQEIAAPEG